METALDEDIDNALDMYLCASDQDFSNGIDIAEGIKCFKAIEESLMLNEMILMCFTSKTEIANDKHVGLFLPTNGLLWAENI